MADSELRIALSCNESKKPAGSQYWSVTMDGAYVGKLLEDKEGVIAFCAGRVEYTRDKGEALKWMEIVQKDFGENTK